ncbi:uncharacterized protein KY384_001866 [Bacidia gigantensis]|uniref:uncharacterized protein n=1 Tax=Bacidia gigantensis TaxID=2732470 RepID=UPI001D04D724|nr:uncharacterized protein KY384_001866 [Bacidia gigantensis]KAG8533083.1 hypothetical protein KY384_001866 [Bacidia gigantensis]
MGQTTPMTPTPTGSTPGSSTGFGWQRPASSHSASTPTSAQYGAQHFFREPSQPTMLPNGVGMQHGPPHMSPQSSAPLGPPSLRPRPSLERQQISPVPEKHRRNLSGELRTQPSNNDPNFPFASPSRPSVSRNSSSGYESRHDRQKSVSVSPKTKASNLPHFDQQVLPSVHGDFRGAQYASSFGSEHNRKSEQGSISQASERPSARRMSSMGIDSMLNAVPSDQTSNKRLKRSSIDTPTENLYDKVATVSQPSSDMIMSHHTPQPVSPSTQPSVKTSQDTVMTDNTSSPSQSGVQDPVVTSASVDRSSNHKTKQPDFYTHRASKEVEVAAYPKNTARGLPPQKPQSNKEGAFVAPDHSATKRVQVDQSENKPSLDLIGAKNTRLSEDRETLQKKRDKPPRLPQPVWARSVLENQRKPGGGPIRPQRPFTKHSPKQANGHISNGVSVPASQPQDKGPLGHWEPSILNVIPLDEVTRFVSDFLFMEVMQHLEIGVAPAGGSAGGGAVLEIEAKIGRLIDKNTMDRISIPVMTETVFNRNSPSHRTHFESSMTELQHRALNEFLNDALKKTLPPKPLPHNPNTAPHRRVKMDYKHTREVDTFFDLTQQGLMALPASLNVKNNKIKVRITRDQKTGNELARIVKTRLADVEIYSPFNQVDWRVSVNVEMDFQGDLRDLIETDDRNSKRTERNKDRLSYKHQAYQIDLTQVTPSEGSSYKEHELEIEVSSEEVRKQATLLQHQEPNSLMELISGFVDNVRTLARQVPHDNVPAPISLR